MRLAVPLVVSVTLGALWACSETLQVGSNFVADAGQAPVAESGVTDAKEPPLPFSSDASADASEDAPVGPSAGCGVTFAQAGTSVPIQVLEEGNPIFRGGDIQAGKYALTAYRVYGAGPRGTGNVRETLVVAGSSTVGAYQRLSELDEGTGDYASHGPRGERFTFQGGAQSPQFFATQECPSEDGEQSIEFTADTSTLTLFDDQSFTERVYEKLE